MTTAVRLLQPLSRLALSSAGLRQFTWPWVRAMRSRYAGHVPPIELEATFDDGVRARLSLSSHIEAQLFWQGFQEADEPTVQALKRLLPKDGVFIDCGANIGSFTLVAAKLARQGQVHAFEPSRHHIERLAHNISLNAFGNVKLMLVGLSDQPGEAQLFVPVATGEMLNTGGASLFEGDAVAGSLPWIPEPVKLIRLDDYIQDKGISRVDVVKIDIEGAELRALRGASRMLDKFRPQVLMEIDRENLTRAGESVEEVLSFWQDRSYEVMPLAGAEAGRAIKDPKFFVKHQNVLCAPLSRQ